MQRLLAFFVPVFVLAGVARADHKEGLYEITTTMRMPGMPELPPQKHTQCFTAKDSVPHPPRRAGSDCSVVDVKTQGDRVTWHVKCADARGTFEGDGSVVYAGASFTGSAVLKMTKNGENIQMTQTMEGHRVGECPGGK
jgi:hypothetical protein